MTLAEYVNRFPTNQRMEVRRSIARELGVSEVYIRSMCNGNRSIPGIHALAIERVTNGVVPKTVSCPRLYPAEQ